MQNQDSSQFCITIDYDRQSPHPEQVFLGLSKIIEAFTVLDSNLVNCIDSEIQPVILLEDVEKGSIKVWLKNMINSLPDDGLKNCDVKRILGEYLVKSKYLILSYIDGKESISKIEEVEALEQNILEMAKNTNTSEFECYTKPERESLLRSMSNMGDAFGYFRNNDHIYIETVNGNSTIINKNFRLPKSSIEQFCAGDTFENTIDIILKVRRPDFLGDAQWGFRHGKNSMDAKILDDEWLSKYRNREVAVFPGDSLKVNLQSVVTYGKDNELISEKNAIIKVYEVVPGINSGNIEQITCLE